MMYHTFSQLSYVANYGWLSILIIVLCDKLWLAVCYYHINYHFFLYYSKSIKYETFDKMCEKCVVLVSSRNIYIYIGATNGQTFMWKVDMFINAITLIFFTKVPHFFGKQRYEMLTNGKVQNKCKVGILGARFGHCVGGGGGQSFVFECANSLKKLNGFYFYLLLECFEKKKYGVSWPHYIWGFNGNSKFPILMDQASIEFGIPQILNLSHPVNNSNDQQPTCQICGKNGQITLDCYYIMYFSYEGKYPPSKLAVMAANSSQSLGNTCWLIGHKCIWPLHTQFFYFVSTAATN